MLHDNSKITLKLYDVTGNEVSNILSCSQTKGEHNISYNAADLKAGFYLMVLLSNDKNTPNVLSNWSK